MVQSLGISIGNASSYVAAGQGGGIEILLNEYSNRSTPTMVAFTDHCRSIGVDAASNLFMNSKNTIYDIMLLLGKPFKEIDTNKYPFKLEEGNDGQALVVVGHLGDERKFTLTQILAMLFTKLKDVANNATDCVISCPQFFNEIQKAELEHASLIAGLRPLQLISDTSAVILNYAYYRTTREQARKLVAFVDFGQSNLQVAIALLNPREDLVQVLSKESELIGGRDFDRALADYFIKEHNLVLTHRGYLKLLGGCEKLKKNLSTNTGETPINVESLVSGDDFTGRIDRAKFEEICQPLITRVESCLSKALKTALENLNQLCQPKPNQSSSTEPTSTHQQDGEQVPDSEPMQASQPAVPDQASPDQNQQQAPSSEPSNIPPSESTEAPSSKPSKAPDAPKVQQQAPEPIPTLEVVEIVGGSTRIPMVRSVIQNVFNLEPSTTLNTDEAVARGCVLHCATLHPGMKVKREVRVHELDPFFKPQRSVCDQDLRRIENDLIDSDRKHQRRTESRNNLEEYIYCERSKNQDPNFLDLLNNTLEWVFSDEGEEAPEEDYINKLVELKRAAQNNAPQTKQIEIEMEVKE